MDEHGEPQRRTTRIAMARLGAHVDERVRVCGWVTRVRELSKVTFVVVRDATGSGQVVLGAGDARLAQVTEESVVEVYGEVRRNEKAPGGVELVDADITVLSTVVRDLPFEVFRPTIGASLPVQLDAAALSLRHPSRQRALQVAAASTAGFRGELDARGFVEVFTPKIVGTATESGATVFALDYFGRRGYLAQSPQFYKQACVGVLERVYEVGPVFRAEPHDTTRHLAQYTSLDVEVGFIDDHHDVMAVARDVVAAMLTAVHEMVAGALDGVTVPAAPDTIPAVHFAEALSIAAAATGDEIADELDLSPAHERALGRWAQAEHGSEFLFVTGYPMAKRPFYTHPDPQRPAYSRSFDLLFRGVELVTGGQRLHRHEDYLAALAARGEDPAPYAGYLDTFRYGMPPHGGFAIGLERWVAGILGAANVREVTAFPRDLHRIAP